MESPDRRRMYRRYLLELREVPALEWSRAMALEDFLRRRLQLIEDLYRELGNPGLKAASQEELIVLSCRLQNLYSAFESVFRRVASDFRRLVPVTRRPLLDRMRMDLSPVRPALLDGEAFEKLDVLARFRHRSRQDYERPLERQDVESVLRKALELRAIYRPRMEAFLEFIQRVR